MASESSYSKSYRTNLPAPKLKPTPAELEKYNTEFYGILGQLTNIPFFKDTDANGRRVEGKRFPALNPAEDDSMTPEQKEWVDAMGPERLKIGPTNPWKRAPGMTKVMNEMLAYFNLKSELHPMAKEIGILVTARNFNSDFEWYAHEPPALHSGASKACVDAIRANVPPPVAGLSEDENTLYTFCWKQYNGNKRTDQVTWNKVRALIGERAAVELLGVMAYYSWVSMSLNVDEFPIPPDTEYHL